MKDFAFVSDFDGTMTDKDFYIMMIERHLGDKGMKFFEEWRSQKPISVEFMNKIFNSINCSEEEVSKDILEIPFDPTAIKLIEGVKSAGGDFFILSAGTSYYINKLLETKGINGIQVISNNGIFKDKGIHMIPDDNSPYYSELYGIDKRKALVELKKSYSRVYFAGDSVPDLKAALEAHVVFARSELIRLLEERKAPHIPVKSFADIYNYMRENKLI